MKVPASGPSISDEDIALLHKAVDDRWFTEHKYCRRFEYALSEKVEKDHIQLCNSGSSASLLAIAALSILEPTKKHILTCALGFPTTVSPIYYNGKVPIFIDVDPVDLGPDLVQLETAMEEYGDEIAGVVFTHTLGIPYDECKVREIIGDTRYIVDSCDALGAYIRTYDEFSSWSHVGLCSDMTTFSFFPAHHICAGEGGAVATNDENTYKILRSLANWGKSCHCLPGQDNVCGQRFCYPDIGDMPEGYDHKYIYDYMGFNLKMTELSGALGYSQMLRLDDFILQRLENYQFYFDNLFYKYAEYLQFTPYPLDTMPSPFGFPIIVREDAPFTAEGLIGFLEDRGVGTRRMFAGNLIRQPALKSKPYKTYPTPSADFLMESSFWVGVQPSLTDEMKEYTLDMFDEFFRKEGLK